MAITLFGPDSVIAGSLSGTYQVALDSVTTLAAGDSVTFTLDTLGDVDLLALVADATEGIDFAALLAGNLVAGSGITLSALSTGPKGAITLTATNTSGSPLSVGSQLLSFQIQTFKGSIEGTSDLYEVTLSSASEVVINDRIVTAILNIIQVSTSPAEWLALNGDLSIFAGIAGTELSSITVSTGIGNNSVELNDAIAFATLDTGDGNDNITILVEPTRDYPYVQFGHGTYFATIKTGAGEDIINVQSNDNVSYVRSSPTSAPQYDTSDYYQSIVDAGADDDYVYAFLPFQSQFYGGSGVDTIFFYGTYADWSFVLVDDNNDGGLDITASDAAADFSVWTAGENLSSNARQNRVQGFEFIQFNDILLDVHEALVLAGDATVAEAADASYSISLDGNGLLFGQSIAFTLRLSPGSALQGTDLAALAASSLSAVSGATLQIVSVDSVSGLISAVVTANDDFSSGEDVATLSVSTLPDAIVEGSENFSIVLSGFIDPASVTTTITDDDVPVVRLSGPTSLLEGDLSTAYTVSLGTSVGLGAGQSVSFTLDSASGTAL
ncbi:MAG: hypothetical protein ACKO5F_08260, partial [Synechococcus sp.]